MTNPEGEYSKPSTTSTFSAAEHLQLAGTLLQREAANLVSGRQARTLQALAEIFNGLAIKLDAIGRTRRRPA